MNKQMTSAVAQVDQTPVVLISAENNLEVKEVDFLGDSLVVVKDVNENKIYTGVGYVCKGLGLSEGQLKSERKKIQEDAVLSKGGRNFVLATSYGDKETVCIDIDYLPLWLAKISITPKMKEQQPKVVEKLVQYQLKAKDVLASAFIHNQVILSDYSTEMQALLIHDKQIQKVKKRVDALEDNIAITRSQQKQLKQFVNKVVVSALGSRYSNAYKMFSGKVFSAFWHDYYNHFNVSSYLDTPKLKYQEALQFVNDWMPNNEIECLIKGANIGGTSL